ncbi:PfkB family carbohydrate kinase [Thermobrachium celere]|uniref:Pseudouridine kinase n=1 Tax=Thermobrachium celere DSM 8682 TaxID=941824 RepID=R7RUR0_9CLOT|nr:PfkB family carbohydrate kinase [Thermobrachium celere]CDF59203.1 Pseudouridine kinase [Thermobrachium celere DSM 8682]
MTNREREILELIKKNPFITQEEIASKLNIARASVAVHITNLMKKGYILGKGYIVNEDEYVLVIGGANVDIQGFPKSKLKFKDSNPGQLNMSLGGVGRNVAENLARLNVNVKLITAVGEDVYGQKILEHSKNIGIDMSHSLVLSGEYTSTYLSILNEKGDMEVALSCMDICEKINVDYIKAKRKIIEGSRLCVVDTNIPKEAIEVLTEFDDLILFLDTVSTAKAEKVRDIIGNFHTVKPNIYEAEVLTGICVDSVDKGKKACEVLLNKGVRNVFISLGEKGVIYGSKKGIHIIKMPKVEVVNATGAGDAFLAGLVYGYLNEFTIEETVKFAMSAAAITLSSKDTISDRLTVQNVKDKQKELGLC